MVNVELLKQIKEKTNKSDEQLKQEIEGIYSSLDKALPDEMRKTLAFNKLVAQYRKLFAPYAKSDIFECIFIGSSGKKDRVASQRNAAIEFFKANPVDAVKLGFTNEKGTPLWHFTPEEEAKLPAFRKDPNTGKSLEVGKPMPDTQFERGALGKVKVEDKLVTMELKIRGFNCDKEIPLFTPVKLRALKTQKSTDNYIYLNDSGELTFEKIGQEMSEESIRKLLGDYKDRVITISQIEEFVNQHPEYMKFCIMKVFVADILPNPTKTGSQVIRIQDDSIEFMDASGAPIPPMTCWVPEHIKLDFPIYSDVYIIGIPNVSEKGKSINALGIYVPQAFKKMTTAPINPSEDDIQEDLWS